MRMKMRVYIKNYAKAVVMKMIMRTLMFCADGNDAAIGTQPKTMVMAISKFAKIQVTSYYNFN